MRVGFGYDVHRLIAGRPLILGGVTIPFNKGLQGHSDADVLLHAICDALLGAAALGDIGKHFPDSDPHFKNVASTDLLQKTMAMIKKEAYVVRNVDTVVVAEAPPISPHREAMQTVVAQHLGINTDCVSIKATTTEGLGVTGRGKAIAAMATVLLEKRPPQPSSAA